MALTNKQISDALRANGGFVTYAASALNVSYQAIYQRIKRSPELEQVLREVQESHLDLAENELIKKVRDGDLGALCFFLKCKGKKRGYIEKAATDESERKPLPIIDFRTKNGPKQPHRKAD